MEKTNKLKKQIKNKKIFDRIILGIINLIIIQFIFPIAIILSIINVLMVIFTNKRNILIINFMNFYIKMIIETFEYISFISDKTPTPFN